MMILTLVSMVLFITPILAVGTIKGLPESVSAMVYEVWKGAEARALWTLWIYACTALLWMPLFSAAPGWLAWLTLLSMMAVGTLPLLGGQRNTEHYVYGIAAGVLTQVCVAVIAPVWLWLWPPFILVFAWKTCGVDDWRHAVLWMELTAATTLYGSLII